MTIAGLLSYDSFLTRGTTPGAQRIKPVPVSEVKARPDRTPDQAARNAWHEAPSAAWPKAGGATVALPSAAGASGPKKARAGSLPVEIASSRTADKAGPGKVRVETLDRKAAERAGVDGVLLKVTGQGKASADSAVDVKVDYSAFRNAYGGDWASRLTLVQLPDCALTDPKDAACHRGRPLPSASNDSAKGALKATVPLRRTARSAAFAPVLLAATADASGASGAAGDWKATSLSPSGSWQSGSSGGGFGWSYPIVLPEVPGGHGPELALSYSSQAVDGRTAATNNQANWVGDGWSMADSFVERRYKPCIDDMKDGNNKAKNGDLCWGTDNAVLSLNGSTTELVKDDKSGEWKLRQDNGTKIERLNSADRGNGDNDGEYWHLTTPDGTQYYFGYNRLPGWSSGKAETHSTWTVPVHGNHKGEPCHKDAFGDSSCNQAWRWNLDYVVTPGSDAMAYYYTAETNRYARNASSTTGKGTVTEYVRGGYLNRIDYGLRSDNIYGTNAAAARVTFTEAERCLPDSKFACAEDKFTKDNAKYWPDVPFDRYCKSGDECKEQYSPSFWTRKRLAKITTESLIDGAYKTADTWELKHQFPSSGDGSSPALWLSAISHTGHVGGKETTLPDVTFKGIQLPNRVEKAVDAVPPLVRYRVSAVQTETGGTIGVTYSEPECKAGDLPDEAHNARRCHPVYWVPQDSPAADYKPVKDWFHTYVVTQVRESDNTGGAPDKQVEYTYLDGPAWEKSQDELTKPEHRAYSEFRGYGRVQTRAGAGTDRRTLTESRYFRGLNGAQVADSEGNKADDHPAFAGMVRESATYDGDGGKLLSAKVYEPWRKGPTATHAREGLPDLTAQVSGVQAESSRTAVGDGWRRTRTERTFDDYGMPLTETDFGDTAKTGDETCATTTYARNGKNPILNAVATQRVLSVPCGKEASLPGDLISEKRSYYDGSSTLGELPDSGRGLVTRTDEQDAKGTGFVTTGTVTYDQYGRALTVTDALNNKSTTAYTPATGASPTKITVTNALGHTSSTEFALGHSVVTAQTDANGKRVEAEYDGLARLTKVWKPGHPKSAFPKSPTFEYDYQIRRDGPTVVTSKTLEHNGSYRTDYALYDGLLRSRQTQTASATGTGRVIAETIYDTRGLTWKTYGSYYADGDPSGTLVTSDDSKVPNVTENLYDGAGRVTDTISRKYGDETKRTRTIHEGDRTTVIPPKGGTATTTVTDALGRQTELIQYTNDERTASQSTRYSYNAKGQREKVTDPEGSTWTYRYDARGREVQADDPDKGLSTTAYDALDRPVALTDAKNATLTTVYDVLGRKTQLKQNGTVLSEWVYDTVAKGQLTSASRIIGGKKYTFETTAFDDWYNPTADKVTIPDSEGGLAGTYEWTRGYNANNGLPEWVRQPAIGGLAAERVTTNYDDSKPYDLPLRTTVSGATLVADTKYDAFSRPLRRELGTQGKRLWETKEYDEHTGDLTHTTTEQESGPSGPGRLDDVRYTYDAAGNMTRLTTVTGQGEAAVTDTQCFVTDSLRRITHAWTATDACAAKPEGGSRPKVGGPDAYWHSYTYDAVGSRQTETLHDAGGDTSKDVQRAYAYPAKDARQRRALTSVTTSRGEQAAPERSDDFVYDAVGNTVLRRTDGKEQVLDWDTEGHLTKVTEGGRTTSYVYDAGGARLIRKDAEGSTLYLPGGNELLLKPDGTTKVGTRYYTHSGETTAVRTAGKLSYVFSDHHNTGTTAVDAATQMVNRRKLTIFGAQRGAAATAWPGDRGFIGGTKDNSTGLTHLGAREYDPATARFISVDPLMDVSDPQQLHGYSYGNNNPLLYSDPDGKWWGLWAMFELVNQALEIFQEAYAPRAVRPHASNQKLNNYLGNIYARDQAKNVYGNGKVGSAIKYELRNGHRLVSDGMEKDQWHVQKGWAVLSGLSELIDGDRAAREGAKGKNAVRLSDEDLATAKREAQELWEALNSRDVTGNVAKDFKGKPQLEKEMRGNRDKVVKSAGMQDVTGQSFERNKYNGRPEPVGEPTKMRGFARAFGVVGGVAQVGGYARDVQRHGFQQATKDLIKNLVDPFGLAKRVNTPHDSGCPC